MGEVVLLVQYGSKKVEVKADVSWSIKDLKLALVDILGEDAASLSRMRILSKGMVTYMLTCVDSWSTL